jgi:hypothetical protein
MIVTKVQRRALTVYKKFRQHEPSLGSMLMLAWKAELLLVALMACVACYFLWIDLPGSDYVIAGIAGATVGVVLRDVGWYRRFVQLWPALVQLLDWTRIEQILDDPESDFAS